MHVKSTRASPQRHCSPCWRFHLSAADLIFEVPLLIALSACHPRLSSFWSRPRCEGDLRAPSSRSWQGTRMPLASGCGPQAEPCGHRLSSCLRRWKGGREGPGLCGSICFPWQVKASVSLPAAGASIRLPRDHVQIQTGGKEAAAEHVFILSSWPPWEKGGQTRQAQRWGVYRGTRLIVSPGLHFPQQVPRAFQPQSLHQQRFLLKPVPGAHAGKL